MNINKYNFLLSIKINTLKIRTQANTLNVNCKCIKIKTAFTLKGDSGNSL